MFPIAPAPTSKVAPSTTRSAAGVLSPARLTPPGRVIGLDMARALALLGMISTHLYPARDGPNVHVFHLVAAGRSAALFAILAGVSLALVTGRQRPPKGRARVAVSAGLAARAVVIWVLGVWLAKQDSGIAVILPMYGLVFLLVLPFIGFRARTLALIAGTWAVLGPIGFRIIETKMPKGDLFGWTALERLLVSGEYPAFLWIVYFLAGLAAGRLDLRSTRVAVRLLVSGAGLAIAATLISDAVMLRPSILRTLASGAGPGVTTGDVQGALDKGFGGFVPPGSWWWLTTHSPHSGTAFDFAQTIGSALAVIGACLLVGRAFPRLTAVIFGAGTMTLTLYSLHVLMNTEPVWPDDVPASFPIHVLVVLGIGAAFRLLGRRGPLETVVGWTSHRTTGAVNHLWPDRAPEEIRPGRIRLGSEATER